MINMDEITRQLTVNAEAIRAMLQSIPDEQAHWKPAPETWSLKEVMEHVYNEERIDFRLHLTELLKDQPQPWPELRWGEYAPVASCQQALEGFLLERKASIAWLKALNSPDWNTQKQIQFDPSNQSMTLSAGDALVAWLEHDYLHLRQVIELLHAWNVKQAPPYSVNYAGGW